MSSTATIVVNTDNNLVTNFKQPKIFLGHNRVLAGSFTNTSGGDKTFPQGTLIGRIASSGELEVLKSAAVDGSNIPLGVLAEDTFLLNAASANVNVCVEGDVRQDLLVFDGSDDLDTIISDRRLGDRILGDTAGIILVPNNELTAVDNS